MRCRACDRENRDGARFCRGCGAALPLSCPNCGAPLARSLPDTDLRRGLLAAAAAPPL